MPIDQEDKAIEPEIDLEKIRDEKCVPIAQTVLKELAESMIPSTDDPDFSHKPSAIKVLSLFLAEDLNVISDTPYIPQLILGVLAGCNLALQDPEVVTPPDDTRFNIIARKVLAIVAEADIRMVGSKEESIEDFIPVKEKLKALFAEEKMTTLEVKYVMDNIFDSFTSVNNIVSSSLQSSTERAEAKMFGIESMSDLSTKKLNEVLLS